jgi:hypothetical protein
MTAPTSPVPGPEVHGAEQVDGDRQSRRRAGGPPPRRRRKPESSEDEDDTPVPPKGRIDVLA